ncbi:ABC-type phosphate transport system [Proteiniphilum saccharofermentans]|jgi:phosphate transport system permease protein|uniref:Phosphate transport system permease protein PstA n=1 Tax=Proteiniphilum saccharofermentans TaxID=1642647 RepID=A0A1R3SY17_9BACT|nr:phosphate ABC transporter permease PstA [Proteiniphilum saccharofermentans]SCD20401.1 ABC-type phosphate transport system [Proteiniphilum saccharofermentans]SEA38326.1 phosphate ABC transporter membrane protein 2, PhoT family [Porphyromonadaceae bacterium KH3R12]SFL59944.1 phosphate ABC transporter membrane protein 2, PhoT family [Porphyromonadaceae bacterium KH3CP3RA]SFT07397.1 phosphate ABC transporter membrane protein 2, PhoT family [Porphyromonadaceae bacterium NLAE-zl-C104]
MNHHKITHTGWRKGKDKTTFVLVCLFSLVAMFPLFFILWDVISKGYKNFNLRLFTEVTPSSMDAMLARMNGEPIPGGILNGITGTVLIVGMAILFSVFLGLFIGIYLADNRGKRFAGVVSYLTDLLQGMPSIVIGIIAYAWIVKPLGGYSALAGSVALTIMMLPMIVRSTEETLKMLPVAYKEAGLALGSSYTSVVFRILIPSGFGGIFTGILLAVSRVMGETAPLMLTALGASVVNWKVMEPTSAIPLLIWDFYNDPNLVDLIWSSSLLLLIVIFLLNWIAKIVARKWKV